MVISIAIADHDQWPSIALAGSAPKPDNGGSAVEYQEATHKSPSMPEIRWHKPDTGDGSVRLSVSTDRAGNANRLLDPEVTNHLLGAIDHIVGAVGDAATLLQRQRRGRATVFPRPTPPERYFDSSSKRPCTGYHSAALVAKPCRRFSLKSIATVNA